MNFKKINLLEKLSVFGVAGRNMVKNDLEAIRALIRSGYVKKAYKKGGVFYELTEDALPLLDARRKILQQLAELKCRLYPRRQSFYRALLEDVRFLDPAKKEANKFLFLGDWQLNRPPVKAQLLLAQHRFYLNRGLV